MTKDPQREECHEVFEETDPTQLDSLLVIALVVAGAVSLGIWAGQASSWPGQAPPTTAGSPATTVAPTTTTTASPAVQYKTIEIKFDYEAGAAQYKTWTAGSGHPCRYRLV